MRNLIELIITIWSFAFIAYTCGFAQNSDIYELHFTNGNNVKALSFKIRKDNIIFYDSYNLEHLINKSKVSLIKKIENQKNTSDEILLTDSSKKEGNIIEIKPNKQLVFCTLSGDTLIIPINNLKSIGKKTLIIENRHRDKLELGFSLGFPAAINFMTAVWFKNLGLRLSGLYIGIAKGVQLNFCYKFPEKMNLYHSIAFVFGNSDIEKDKFRSISLKNFHWQYLGLVYDLNIRDFWTELGLSYGKGNYNNPQIIFQIGYSTRIF